MALMSRGGLVQNLEPGVSSESPAWNREPTTWAIFFCFPRNISWELAQKWSIWDSNWHPHGGAGTAGRGLTYYAKELNSGLWFLNLNPSLPYCYQCTTFISFLWHVNSSLSRVGSHLIFSGGIVWRWDFKLMGDSVSSMITSHLPLQPLVWPGISWIALFLLSSPLVIPIHFSFSSS